MEERVIEWYAYGETIINPLALLFTMVMCILIIFLRKERIILPLLLIAFFITDMQRIVLFNINLPLLRIALLIGLARAIVKKNESSMKLNKIDKIMIIYGISRVTLHTIQLKTTSALIGEVGMCCDILGAYFVVRYALDDFVDIKYILKVIAVLSILIALAMLIEKSTHRNIFSVFGGVPEITMERGGKLRAQAAFSHPILAGTFGATLIPFMWALWNNNYKKLALLGMFSGIIISITSASSGPILTLFAAMFGIFLWRLRNKMRLITWGGVILLVLLHLVMKAPVWNLLARIDISGGSTGYHRAMLIDSAIRRFPEWFLFGIRSTAHWGWGLQDVTNMFILEGVNAGIVTMILFIIIILLCFKAVGYGLNSLKENIESQKILWVLGAVLFAHVVSFIGVSYFGHMVFYYYLLIAIISSLYNFRSILNLNNIEELKT